MSEFLIIGSVAMKHWFPDYRRTISPRDIDVITREAITVSSSLPSKFGVECHSNEIFAKMMEMNRHDTFMDASLLYTLKMSHAQWNIKWDKTLTDIIFMQGENCELNKSLYDELVSHWTEVHGKKRVNLNMTNDQFFSDAVRRKIDHDRLHEIVAYNDYPMHTLIRPDKSSPKADKALWDALSDEDKLKTAIEEICVIAIERYGLTKDSKTSEIYPALSKAYKSLVTTMTTGWFCDYLLLNAKQLLLLYRFDMITLVRKAVNSEKFLMENVK